jgi:hypothetical protein
VLALQDFKDLKTCDRPKTLRRPKMTAQIRTLQPFIAFSRLMNELPYLKKVNPEHRLILLGELYKAAQATVTREEVTAYAKDLGRDARKSRQQLSLASSRLREALLKIREAREIAGLGLDVIAKLNSDLWESSFAEIERNLKAGIDLVTSYEGLNAALVHPKLRTSLEKHLAAKPTPVFGGLEDAEDHVPYSMSEKQVAVDTSFTREAGACLDRYRTVKNRKITHYDLIIKRLYKAAFGVSRSADSIRKALDPKRQGTTPKLKATNPASLSDLQ